MTSRPAGCFEALELRDPLQEELAGKGDQSPHHPDSELAELKSRVVSMISHDFRTPLSTILSSAELLEHYGHKLDKEKKREHLRRIQDAVKEMTQLLNHIILRFKSDQNGEAHHGQDSSDRR